MRSKYAFTLIELLVVIAIIGVLAAILFPVFARAKSAANDSVTLSNLKQLGAAFSLYFSDNDDRMPGVTDGFPGINREGGWVFYDQFGNGQPGHFDVSRGALNAYVKNAKVFTTPSDRDANQSGLSFAYNGCLVVTPFQPTGLNFGRSTTELANPAGTMLVGEEGTYQGGFFSSDPNGGTNDGFLNPDVDAFSQWHAGGTAILYTDIHAKITHARDKFTETTSGDAAKPCW